MRRQQYFRRLYQSISCLAQKSMQTTHELDYLESLCSALLRDGKRATDFKFVYAHARPRSQSRVQAYRNLRRLAMQQSIRAGSVGEIKKIFADTPTDVRPVVIEHWIGLARTRNDFMEAYRATEKRGIANEVMLRRKFIAAASAVGVLLTFPKLAQVI
ncbi:MAG TPA: hypothetical protein VJ579_04980 [Candidatus Paceibacterota bacterium]|nr:hypothetical protein [Candidatus Paceibacterota bacterium]